MALHTLYIPDIDPDAGEITLAGDEARHALRVKRVRPGERVRILDGRGGVATAEVAGVGRELTVRLLEFERGEPVRPEVRVWSPAPKGPRAGDMIDALSQVGAASWTPMVSEFSGEGITRKKIERLERVAIEAAKQCGRAWLLRIECADRPARFEEALRSDDACERIILADASGAPLRLHGADGTDGTNGTDGAHESHRSHSFHQFHDSGADNPFRLLIGPEGGWSAKEMEAAGSAGVEIASFGPHAMRIETAAPVAAAIALREAGAASRRTP